MTDAKKSISVTPGAGRMKRLRERLGRTPTSKEWLIDAGFDPSVAEEAAKQLREAAREARKRMKS
jgi:folylpolyglutamate synthase/dihydropteroate synthase